MGAPRVTLGRVAGVYGVKGWVKIHSDTRPIANILRYRRWWIGGQGRQEYRAQLVDGRPHGATIVAQLSTATGEPITERDVAAALVGASIQVERSELPRLPDGEYYWIDLVGVRVENKEGIVLGTVSDVTSNGAQDILVVGDGAVRRLIPFVMPQIIESVDMAAGRIVCDWQPEYDED